MFLKKILFHVAASTIILDLSLYWLVQVINNQRPTMLMNTDKSYKILLLKVDKTHIYISVFMWLNGNEIIICYYLSFKLLGPGVQSVYIHHTNIGRYI